jgi:2-methylcitrate dehydratase PrpD
MDKINEIVKIIIDTKYEQLPVNVVGAIKRLILDTLAAAYGGSTEKGVKECVEIFNLWGGRDESTIWVYGGKLPCVNAAQINATMVHASDYDDTHDPSPIHTGAVAIPTALALAEMNEMIDGKKIIVSIALGAELAIRLSMACKRSQSDSGWHFTALHGNFNAAAVAGKILDLDEDSILNAFGIAYHQAGGNLQCVRDGAIAKRIGPGFAARNGITAALMAQKGISGAKNILEGACGLFNIYHLKEYNPSLLSEKFLEMQGVMNTSLKPYPCCRNTHPCIDATLAIFQENKISIIDIETIRARVSPIAAKALCEPIDVKRNPRTIVDAQFSIPWTIAVAAVKGKIEFDSFTDKAIRDETLLMISNKVQPVIDDSIAGRGVTATVVEIKTKNGGKYYKHIETPYGAPENPMSDEDIYRKFINCADHAAKPIKKQNVEKIIERISNLENLKNIKNMIRLLS